MNDDICRKINNKVGEKDNNNTGLPVAWNFENFDLQWNIFF